MGSYFLSRYYTKLTRKVLKYHLCVKIASILAKIVIEKECRVGLVRWVQGS